MSQRDEAEHVRRRLTREIMLSASGVSTRIVGSSSFSIRAYGKRMWVSVGYVEDNQNPAIVDCEGHEERFIHEGDR